MTMAESDDPRRLDASLDKVARSLGGVGASSLRTLFAHWPDIVGAQIADHARPIALAGGVLTLATHEPGWSTQLTYLEADLLRLGNEIAGAEGVLRCFAELDGAESALISARGWRSHSSR